MLWALVIGVAAGFVSGMLGVGGGVLFVPGLVLLLGESQVDAEATSLLAIIPVALLGTWRQSHYGNVRLEEGLMIGALAALGAVGGVALANVLPGHSLRIAFCVVMLLTAAQLVRRMLRAEQGDR